MTDDRASDDRVPDDRAGLTDDDLAAAAEYALGASEGAERARAAHRVAHDAPFRHEVEAWHAWLEPLLDEVADEAPPAHVWRGVEAEIGRADAQASERGRARSAERPGRRASGTRAVPTPAGAMAPWRALALMGLGGAFAGLVLVALVESDLLVAPGAPTPSAPTLVATLTADGASPALARLDESGAITVRIGTLGEGPDTVPQLWLIPEGGAPVSLGLPGEGDALALPADATPAAGATLAVSLEPPGGSPTGAPTGPVVATGTLIEL